MRIIMMNIVAAMGLILGGSALASGMPALAKKNGCDVCHDIDKRVVGPSWMEVSKKYKRATKYTYGGKEYTVEDGLLMKVSKGGSGNWASMPMPANDSNGANQGEMRELVKFILGLAK
jgi:cytochrome c